MKKLQIEELKVDSFTTSETEGYRGTVLGHVSDTYRLSECPGYCTDPGGGQSEFCYSAANCTNDCPTRQEDTCNGATNCGTCFPHATCDLQGGCGGTSFDNQMC